MIAVRQQVDLSTMNTLGLPAEAARYAEPASEAELVELLGNEQGAVQVIGEGSNLVLGGSLPGLVIRPMMVSMEVVGEQGGAVLVEAGAGVHWDDLVAWAVAQGFHGLENLSWIPGSVGAAPFQNIGAYGVELSDRFESLRAVDRHSGAARVFSRDDCQFGYRDSVFKSVDPGRWVITSLRLRLSRDFHPRLDYGDLEARFHALPASEQNASGLRQLVIRVRDEKLPNPAHLANAGSFFKNPVVSAEQWRQLQSRFANLVAFAMPDGGAKLAAGWLIEQAGWKGRQLGPVGMHERQALVLVNYGGASAADVLALQQAVQQSVWEKFAVRLEREPIWLPRAPESD